MEKKLKIYVKKFKIRENMGLLKTSFIGWLFLYNHIESLSHLKPSNTLQNNNIGLLTSKFVKHDFLSTFRKRTLLLILRVQMCFFSGSYPVFQWSPPIYRGNRVQFSSNYVLSIEPIITLSLVVCRRSLFHQIIIIPPPIRKSWPASK